jgi:hypothetical protein
VLAVASNSLTPPSVYTGSPHIARLAAVSLIGADEVGLPLRSLNDIARSLKIALQGFEDVVPLPDTLFAGQHGSFDRCGLDHAEYLSADSFIYRDATESDASRFAVIEPATDTGLAQHIVTASCISHRQLTPTTRASQESCEQRLSIFSCAGPLFSLCVLSDGTLDVLELFPAHITFMGTRDQREPLLPGLAPAEMTWLCSLVAGEMFGLP